MKDNLFPWVMGALMAICAMTILSSIAHGHDDAAWIMRNPAYLDSTNVHCCGPVDCRVVTENEVERIVGGWRHIPTQTTIIDGQQGDYPSIDAQTWRCVRAGAMRCIFTGAGM